MNKISPALTTLRKAAANASQRGFHAEAQAIALRALHLAAHTAGTDSDEYMQCAQEAVSRSCENSDWARAGQYQYIVLALTKKRFGEEHLLVAQQLRLLGEMLRGLRDEIGAKAAEKQAASILKSAKKQSFPCLSV